MKKLVSIILVVLLLLLSTTSCSVKKTKDSDAEFIVTPEMSDQLDLETEPYIWPGGDSCLFLYDFSENDYSSLTGEEMMRLFSELTYLRLGEEIGEFDEKTNSWLVSFKEISTEIKRYLPIPDEELKTLLQSFWDEQTEMCCCYMNYFGGAYPDFETVKTKQSGDIVTVDLRYKTGKNPIKRAEMQVKIKVESDGGFKYLSNKINKGDTSNELTYPLMNAEQQYLFKKYIHPVIGTYLFSLSFTETDYSNIYKECLTSIFGYSVDKDSLKYDENNGYWIASFDMIKEEIGKYLLIPDDVLKQKLKTDYLKEEDAYRYYGGLGGGDSMIFVDKWEEDNSILTLHLKKYDNESIKLIEKAVLKIRLEDDGGFKYLSNEVTNLYD